MVKVTGTVTVIVTGTVMVTITGTVMVTVTVTVTGTVTVKGTGAVMVSGSICISSYGKQGMTGGILASYGCVQVWAQVRNRGRIVIRAAIARRRQVVMAPYAVHH